MFASTLVSAPWRSLADAVFPQELNKFNDFFMEKEEELVMLDSALGERASKLLADPAAPPELLASTCTALAKFHGELVLLEHWCSLNYAALVKILKKHDKRSRLSLRLPILVNVLHQPFYSTEVLSKLVRTAEERFQAIASRLKAGGAGAEPAAQGDTLPVELPSLMQLPPPPSEDAPPAPDEEASMLARTRAALSCWQALSKSQSLGAAGAADQNGAGHDADDSSGDERAPPVPPPDEQHAKRAKVA